MCLRYHIAEWNEQLPIGGQNAPACRFGDISPGAFAPVLSHEGALILRWGARCLGGMLVSESCERAPEKAMLRHRISKNRVLLPADGFYVQQNGLQYDCCAADGGLLYIGALRLHTIDGARFILLTRRSAGPDMPQNARMPLLIAPKLHNGWLSGDRQAWIDAVHAQPPELSVICTKSSGVPLF